MRGAAPLQLCAAAALLLACARAADALGPTRERICPSMDIRNSADKLHTLRGCTIIDGQLRIVLMERTNASSFENISFPELREVTGFIQVYRLKGLRTLGEFFPNLSVIRGLQLYRSYALVIYDNVDLQTVGLRSLTRIERGSVRIERNDKLCYTDTIDWSQIVTKGAENNIIRRNYDSRLCGLCPKLDDPLCSTDVSGRSRCWDESHCQKVCPSSCGDRACMSSGECCHPECLGGCSGRQTKDCHVCRNFMLGYGKNRTCVTHCPDNMYELNKRCVSQTECTATPLQADAADAFGRQAKYYKPFKGKCLAICPTGYMEMGEGRELACVECPPGGCVRTCEGGVIDSVDASVRLRGCTHIVSSDKSATKSSIEISLRAASANTVEELETNLGSIREIQGYLKVVRSLPVVSLSFFKSLRRIGGQFNGSEYKQYGRNALHVFNNPNLELLWNWTTHGKIEISSGKLFIHFNPKLCYMYIEPLKNMTKDPESTFEDMEVSKENNGDQASCYPDTINLYVQSVFNTVAVLHWDNYCLDDARKLLGYSIYYTVAKQNITRYERRDACYDSWTVHDKPIEEVLNASSKLLDKDPLDNACSRLQPAFHPITQLTPFTRYAVYVKTFTTLQDKSGAQSPIVYFKTLPGRPSQPKNLVVLPDGPHTVHLRWTQPEVLHCDIKTLSYRIEVQANAYNEAWFKQIDYCANPSSLASLFPSTRAEEAEKKKYLPNSSENKDEQCSCKDQNAAINFKDQQHEIEDNIDFENALQNDVYIRKKERSGVGGGSSRAKRSSDNTQVTLSTFNVPNYNYTMNNTYEGGYIRSYYIEVDSTNVTLTNLRHFSWYTVSIWACRQRHPNETTEAFEKTWCSIRSYELFRTPELPNADVVTNVRAEVIPSNKTLPEVNVTWEPPQNPNGIIVAYSVYHSRIDSDSPSVETTPGTLTCVGRDEWLVWGGATLRGLTPGNYSVRVAPVTLRALGNLSRPIYFYIPERDSDSTYAWAWGVAGGFLIMCFLAAGGFWFARRNFLPPAETNKLFASVNPEYVPTVYVPDEWEVPREDIDLVRELGQGSFGMVYEGLARNIVKGEAETRCAVKTVNEHATDRERVEFLKEASVMKAFDTWHVVRLLGVVSRGQPTLVVMELMAHGDLKSYLRRRRSDPPPLSCTYQMAIEIADGMAYLAAKKFVHRDLAARNCMVADDLTVKVGDFGMTRDIYETDYYRKGSKGLLPVRWMSPESLKDGVFSSNSDVWSYGVVLWEMATLAMQPYQGLSNEQVLRYVVEGGVMERPEHCPDRLYELMRSCWAHRPASRPGFLALVSMLLPHAAPHFRHRAFYHTPHAQQLALTQAQAAQEDEVSGSSLNVGAMATGSGSNLFGVSGRLASWVRELSSLRSRGSDDAAAEPLAPPPPPAPRIARPPNGDATTPC